MCQGKSGCGCVESGCGCVESGCGCKRVVAGCSFEMDVVVFEGVCVCVRVCVCVCVCVRVGGWEVQVGCVNFVLRGNGHKHSPVPVGIRSIVDV